MAKVYIVTMYKRERHYHCEERCSEEIMKIFDSEEKAHDYITNKIERDHWFLDEGYPNDPEIIKYAPSMDTLKAGDLANSFIMETNTHFKFIAYRFKSYDVE